jgi:hypothetical protein
MSIVTNNELVELTGGLTQGAAQTRWIKKALGHRRAAQGRRTSAAHMGAGKPGTGRDAPHGAEVEERSMRKPVRDGLLPRMEARPTKSGFTYRYHPVGG